MKITKEQYEAQKVAIESESTLMSVIDFPTPHPILNPNTTRQLEIVGIITNGENKIILPQFRQKFYDVEGNDITDLVNIQTKQWTVEANSEMVLKNEQFEDLSYEDEIIVSDKDGSETTETVEKPCMINSFSYINFLIKNKAMSIHEACTFFAQVLIKEGFFDA